MNRQEWLIVALLILFVATARAELTLKPIHPDEPVEHTLQQRFSLESALANMESIKAFLESFRRLTAAAKGKLTARAWRGIGHTDRETQELAFANLPPAVEGALRYQNWLLKKTRHQLAVMELRAGKTPAAKAEQARQEMEQAEKEFQKFWDALSVAD
jgi:hypothetical protein